MTKSFNGNYITEYREKNNLTQAKFAAKFNAYLKEHGMEGDYSNKSVSMCGNREPQNLDITKLLAEFIGVSVDTICNGVHIETTKQVREYPDVNDIVSSWEIDEFVFGDIERKDRERSYLLFGSLCLFISILKMMIPLAILNYGHIHRKI